jgi:threonine dehydratase
MVTHIGAHNFDVIRREVDDIVTVSDTQLAAAMKFFAERMKMIVEPTGCLGAAAALHGAVAVEGKKVGILVSGGNVDLARFAGLVGV